MIKGVRSVCVERIVRLSVEAVHVDDPIGQFVFSYIPFVARDYALLVADGCTKLLEQLLDNSLFSKHRAAS